jgi:hypothetical protein
MDVAVHAEIVVETIVPTVVVEIIITDTIADIEDNFGLMYEK